MFFSLLVRDDVKEGEGEKAKKTGESDHMISKQSAEVARSKRRAKEDRENSKEKERGREYRARRGEGKGH